MFKMFSLFSTSLIELVWFLVSGAKAVSKMAHPSDEIPSRHFTIGAKTLRTKLGGTNLVHERQMEIDIGCFSAW